MVLHLDRETVPRSDIVPFGHSVHELLSASVLNLFLSQSCGWKRMISVVFSFLHLFIEWMLVEVIASIPCSCFLSALLPRRRLAA